MLAHAGCVVNHRERRLYYFQMLEPQARRETLRRLAASGMSDRTIATVTQLSIEMVRRVLGEQNSNEKGAA